MFSTQRAAFDITAGVGGGRGLCQSRLRRRAVESEKSENDPTQSCSVHEDKLFHNGISQIRALFGANELRLRSPGRREEESFPCGSLIAEHQRTIHDDIAGGHLQLTQAKVAEVTAAAAICSSVQRIACDCRFIMKLNATTQISDT